MQYFCTLKGIGEQRIQAVWGFVGLFGIYFLFLQLWLKILRYQAKIFLLISRRMSPL